MPEHAELLRADTILVCDTGNFAVGVPTLTTTLLGMTSVDVTVKRAGACEAAYRDGFEWPPAKGGAKTPYELQPGTGRRGPADLSERFDEQGTLRTL